MTTERSKPGRRPVHSNPTSRNRTARAPYNFIPLPEKIVTVDQEDLPDHDRYAENTCTGWFDCELTTCSPAYVRGMMTFEQHEKYNPAEEKRLPPEELMRLKEERAPFYSAKPIKEGESRAEPMIPGSSLRGLIRSLIEIAGYGKMRWVNNTPKVTFRAVAAAREDPLSGPYKDLIGSFGKNVKAGYLKKAGDGWQIQPALNPKSLGLAERGAYLKVKEARIPNGAIKDFVGFNDSNYWPEYYFVSFNASTKRGKQGPYTSIDQIGDEDRYRYQGTLVCTGSMLEIAKPGLKSPRRNHHLILMPDEKAKSLPLSPELLEDFRDSQTDFQKTTALKIRTEVMEDYLDSLTGFQEDELWQPGGLEDGAPVFYLEKNGEVKWFGHTPNFRVPARNQEDRAATPLDFLPKDLRKNEQPDLAEAIFGWVEEDVQLKLTEGSLEELREEKVPKRVLDALKETKTQDRNEKVLFSQWYRRKEFVALLKEKIGAEHAARFAEKICESAEKDDLTGQRASRVFFSDARFIEAKDGKIWYGNKPLIPSTLGSPKITTFQHYLVQDKSQQHDPDFRQTLAHYGSQSETEIRGHKLYWHKGDNPPDLEATDKQKEKHKQITYIDPIRPGVRFRFRVHFENLRDYELGALAWALQLPDEDGKLYRHKLGMGKPLGMGAVAITASLQLTERIDKEKGRYARMFSDGGLTTGAAQTERKKIRLGFRRLHSATDRARQRASDGTRPHSDAACNAAMARREDRVAGSNPLSLHPAR
jgi:CRISPR-associated protein (TIGR03986 family)